MSQERLVVMLAQLKDMSEMMIDLAYSALLCESEEIADYVLEMEEKMDKLHMEFELAVLELRETRPTKGLLGLIRLALSAEELADAAGITASIVKKGLRAHPVVRMAMERAEETIVATEVDEDAVLDGMSLGEAGLEDDIGMRVIAVRRGDDWVYNPLDSFVLVQGDLVIARGFSEGRERFLTLANPEHIHE